MNLTVSGHHVSVTPAIHSYIEGKLGRVRRHFDDVIDVSVILSVEKLRQRAQVNVHVRGRDIFVHCDDGDLYAAIDDLVDKLDRSIQRHKAHVRVRPQAAFKRNGESSAEEEA